MKGEEKMEEKWSNQEIMELIKEYECLLNWLEIKFSKGKGYKKSRKDEIKEIMDRGKRVFVGDIAKELNITSRNVSSYLTYLRRDGMEIITDSKGRKFIMPE